MGRKRLSPNKKRIGLHITLPKEMIDDLKEKNIIISQLLEKLIKNWMKLK